MVDQGNLSQLPMSLQLTTIDPVTAIPGKEPLETLHAFRSGAGLGWAEAAGEPLKMHQRLVSWVTEAHDHLLSRLLMLLSVYPSAEQVESLRSRVVQCRHQKLEACRLLWAEPGVTPDLRHHISGKRHRCHRQAQHNSGWQLTVEEENP